MNIGTLCLVTESVIEKRSAVIDYVAPAVKFLSHTENVYCPGFFPIPPVAAVFRANLQ